MFNDNGEQTGVDIVNQHGCIEVKTPHGNLCSIYAETGEASAHFSTNGVLSLHINIRGLAKKFDQLKNMLLSLQQQKLHVDFIMLCETFLTDLNQSLYTLPGYNMFCLNRSDMSKGGICLYASDNLEVKLRQDIGGNLQVEGEFESCLLKSNIQTTKSPFSSVKFTESLTLMK